jgi:hypothetical protein
MAALTAIVASFALAAPAMAAPLASEEQVPVPQAFLNEDNSVTFTNTRYLRPGQKLEYTTVDSNGEEVTYGVQAEAREARSGSKRTKVYRYTGASNASFWVTVTNNKITAADSWWLQTIGGTYSDVSLTHNSTEAKLQWVFNFVGYYSGSAYLRAVVTGSNNDVTTRGT